MHLYTGIYMHLYTACMSLGLVSVSYYCMYLCPSAPQHSILVASDATSLHIRISVYDEYKDTHIVIGVAV